MNIVDLRKHNTNSEKQEIIEQPEEIENQLTEKDIRQYVNPQRRQFLKFLLVGSGAFALGLLTKSLGLSGLFSKSKGIQNPSEPQSEAQIEKDFKNWKIVENNNRAIFIDKKTNEEVLILD